MMEGQIQIELLLGGSHDGLTQLCVEICFNYGYIIELSVINGIFYPFIHLLYMATQSDAAVRGSWRWDTVTPPCTTT